MHLFAPPPFAFPALEAPPVTVRRVSSSADLKRFVDFPYAFYEGHPFWVPPLRMDQLAVLNPSKNPFFQHGQIQPFLAEDARGRVVGRIAAIVNGSHLDKYADGNGFFGFFESAEQYEVAEALLDAATAWLREQGLTGVRGPANPSLNDTAGLLMDGFERQPALLMPYNPPYYADFLQRYGFSEAMTMWAYYVHERYVQTERLERGAQLVLRRYPGLTVRALDMDRFDEAAQDVLRIYNEAWAENWGHVPMTEAEFAHLAKDLKQVVDPNMVFFADYEGETVAFSISLPNLNRTLKHLPDGRLLPTGLAKLLARAKLGDVHDVRMALMGVLPEHRGKGFDVLPVLATMKQGPRLGYVGCEMSWVLDNNPRLLNMLDQLGAVRDKRYAMLEMAL